MNVVKGKLSAGASRDLSLGVGGGVPTGATAALVTLSVVNTSTSGSLTAYKKGAAVPATSSIRWDHLDSAVANGTTVGVDSARRITVRSGGGSTHFIVDVLGYYR